MTNLNHVLDATVGMLLNDGLNPDQWLYLKKTSTTVSDTSSKPGLDGVINTWDSRHLVAITKHYSNRMKKWFIVANI